MKHTITPRRQVCGRVVAVVRELRLIKCLNRQSVAEEFSV